jgi:hypothetical protein
VGQPRKRWKEQFYKNPGGGTDQLAQALKSLMMMIILGKQIFKIEGGCNWLSIVYSGGFGIGHGHQYKIPVQNSNLFTSPIRMININERFYHLHLSFQSLWF